jgi:outer membrane protein assembly factor BamE (lipoprotein component of BamABCDE complex)
LGQTKDQVTAGFGQPTRVAKLGVKEIYYYKDMKVTFTNGKVTNVE